MPIRKDFTVTEQMTAPIDFQLLTDADDDGVPETGINLSAADHVELWKRDNVGGTAMFSTAGTQLAYPGTAEQAAGSVQWTPGTADLQSSLAPYQFTFKVYPTSTTWYYVPEDSWNTIDVRPRIG